MKIYKIFVLLILVFFSSCESSKEIDYETYYGGDKIIVHGFVSLQDGVKVLVKKTVAPNNLNADDGVENAVVTLFEDEKAIRLQKMGDYYVADSNFIMKTDGQYSIQVELEDFDKVYSTVQNSFASVPIDSVTLLVEEGTYYQNLVVWFNNHNQLDNAYYLKVYPYFEGELDESFYQQSELFNPYGMIDNVVNGRNAIEYQLRKEKFDSLRIELYTLSPDLKTFLKSFKDYDASKEDPFFEQTYPIYSNIKNGYGIFSIYNYDYKIIK